MKGYKSILLILTVFVVGACIHIGTLSADTNLLTSNPGFEDGISAWYFTNITNAGGEVSSFEEAGDGFVREGQYCLKMTFPTAPPSDTLGNYNKLAGDAIRLTVGSTYEFSILVNTGEEALRGEGAFISVRTYKADNGTGVGTGNVYYTSSAVNDTEGEWVRLSVRFRSVVEQPIQYIYFGVKANTSGTVFWDDARLTQYDEKEPGFGYYILGETGDKEIFSLVPDVSIKAKYRMEAEHTENVVMLSALYAVNASGVPDMIAMEVLEESEDDPTLLCQPKGFTVSEKQLSAANYYIKTFCFDAENNIKPMGPVRTLEEADAAQMKNLFQNGDFETANASGVGLKSWTPYDYSWNNAVSVCTAEVYSGEKCVKIEANVKGMDPYIRYDMKNLVPGTEYCLDLWYKTDEKLSGEPLVKFQYYSDNTSMGASQAIFTATDGIWKHQKSTVLAPENCNRMSILLRLTGTGAVFFDKAAFYAVKLPEALMIEGDTFFYTEWEIGTVSVRVNEAVSTAKAPSITVKLKDGDRVLSEKSFMADEEELFSFRISDLGEIGKAYTIEAALYDTSDTNEAQVGKCEKKIYRYNRPSAINENGDFVENGKVFSPVFGYHVYEDDWRLKTAKAAGVNVVQGGGDTVESAKTYLDNCQANNMKATLFLYGGMKIAGSEEMIDNTIAVVTATKDHPALFGYLVMDEPYLHVSNPYDDLVKTYKTIRDIDPVHPVIIQDSASTASSALCASCADVLIIHDYALNTEIIDTAGIQGTTTVVSRAIRAFDKTNIKPKPIYFLGQTFGAASREEAEANGSNYYLPTIDEAKNMLYQGAWLGTKGIGYYSFKETAWELMNTSLYSGLVDFAGGEISVLQDIFMLGKHTFICENKEGTYWWHISERNGDIYVLVLNMKAEAQTVNIPLQDKNGDPCLTNFKGEKIGGTELPGTVRGNESLSLEMVPHGTALYKLTAD